VPPQLRGAGDHAWRGHSSDQRFHDRDITDFHSGEEPPPANESWVHGRRDAACGVIESFDLEKGLNGTIFCCD